MSPGHHGVLIAGAGLAGVRTAQTLRRLGYDGQIRLLSEESEHPYYPRDFLRGRMALRSGSAQAHTSR